MQFLDVVFECADKSDDDWMSAAIVLAQECLPGKDRTITHASIVFGPGLLLEAIPKDGDTPGGVKFRKLIRPEDISRVCYVMRSSAARPADTEAQKRIYAQGLEAFYAFLGESYSFRQILLHKIDRKLATDMSATLGETFCSALVKRMLTVADVAQGLSKTLLMSPSELHSELFNAGWTSVPVEQWGTIFREPSESQLRLAKQLGLESVGVNRAEKFAEANDIIIKGFEATAAITDATAGLTLAQTGLNPLANHDYPFDMLEEAGLAQRWRELDNFKSPARWKVAKFRDLFAQVQGEIANRLRAALPRVLDTAGDSAKLSELMKQAQETVESNDLDSPSVRRIALAFAPFRNPLPAMHYAAGRDALAGVGDPGLEAIGKLIDARLRIVEAMRVTANSLDL
ncbi:hypothetical protein [Bradyrhizobium sp. URHC0002]